MQKIIAARPSLVVATPPNPQWGGSDLINFNGIGSNAHEPFLFPSMTPSHPDSANMPKEMRGFNFFKTFAKPYDEVVVACLLVARDHFTPAELDIKSDGQFADHADGRALYSQVFNRPPPDITQSGASLNATGATDFNDATGWKKLWGPIAVGVICCIGALLWTLHSRKQ